MSDDLERERLHEPLHVHVDTCAERVTLSLGYSEQVIEARFTVAETRQLIKGLEAAIRIAQRAEPAS